MHALVRFSTCRREHVHDRELHAHTPRPGVPPRLRLSSLRYELSNLAGRLGSRNSRASTLPVPAGGLSPLSGLSPTSTASTPPHGWLLRPSR